MEKHKILIVDDDIDILTLVQAILGKEGFEVITATDKVEGFKKAWSEKPDLAILDVMMTTQFEGFELAKELSENPEFKNMPVLMMSSIDILTTTNPSVQQMAREFRKDPDYKELDVLLVKDTITGNAGIDYKSEDGPSIWLNVDGFLRKPVNAPKLINEIRTLLEKQSAQIV
jgi:DNA-binding response OmpR family regulator